MSRRDHGSAPAAEVPVAHPLGWGLRARLRVRHTGRLLREVTRYGAEQRMWWLLPVVTVMVLIALAITTTTSTLPVAVYTLF